MNDDKQEPIEITSIFEDSKQNIWFGSSEHYVFKYVSGSLKPYKLSNYSFIQERGNSTVISEEPDGALIIDYHDHWYRLHNDTIKPIIKFDHTTNYLEVTHIPIEKTQFIGKEEKGTYTYNEQTYRYYYSSVVDKYIIEFPFSSTNLKQFGNEKGETNIWIADYSNLYRLYFEHEENTIVLRKERKLKQDANPAKLVEFLKF